MVSLAEKPLTGKPDAGNPPVRFGGRGEVIPHPYPYLYSGLKAGLGGGGRGAGAGPRVRAKRGSLRSRSSGGRAAGRRFMGVMYIIATQMSTGYLDFV